MSLLREGATAPLFTAPLKTGEIVGITDYRGKKNVVLFFYPRDFTPGCTREVCAYRDSYADIVRHDAVIFGISYDEAATHDRFTERYNLPFPLLTDADHAISRAYGVARLNGRFPLVKRVTFVIDKAGVIRKVIHREMGIDHHVHDVLAALRALPSV